MGEKEETEGTGQMGKKRTIEIPYGKEPLHFTIEESRIAGILESGLQEIKPERTQEELVEEAMLHPVGSKPLWEMAQGKERVVIIASDHTRPVPSRLLMPVLLREVRRGNPQAKITILIATGCHRGTTKEELVNKFGEKIVAEENIVIHDCDDSREIVKVGELPSKAPLYLNRLAVEADLLVAEGFIEPHFFAGFSGGRKSVLPGVAGRRSVLENHNAAFIASEKARTGILEGNPIHKDMLYAAKAVSLDFILNVVINARKEVIYGVAGDCEKAHEAGCAFLSRYCQVPAVPAPIVITSNGGYPLDQNIYQAVKGLTAAEATVEQGGVIIMCAKAEDGHGGEGFFRDFQEEKDPARMMETFLQRPAKDTKPDQWQSQILARVLTKAKVIFVSSQPDALVEEFGFFPAHSPEEAWEKALTFTRPDASVCVIPDGVSLMVKEEKMG